MPVIRHEAKGYNPHATPVVEFGLRLLKYSVVSKIVKQRESTDSAIEHRDRYGLR
jgi:CRISPR/Cas system-associated protein endoribonuclease Cas2